MFFAKQSDAQLIKDTERLKHLEIALTKQKGLAQKREKEVFDALNTTKDVNEKQALSFILAYAPLSDLADYDGDFFLSNVRMSLKAKQELEWCNKIPEDVFLHFVLPVRVNNENLDSFRIKIYTELAARVKGMTMKQAALEVNHWCHEKVTYKGSDSRTSAPLATMCYSFGRCGEESTFTVAALRTVGIPARQVYTPRWAHCDDNHAWVEVWVDGKWYFMGACEPDPDLNMGWFQGPAKRAMLVHTRAYGFYQGNEEIMTKEDNFSELNLIANYAPVKRLVVKVTGKNNKPVANANVSYRLYNYAEFYPLAKSTTNKDGITGITLGLGDIIVWANLGNAYGFQKVTIESTDTVLIKIDDKHLANYSLDYDLVPPVVRAIDTVADAERVKNSARLLTEDSIRNSYMKSFKDSAWGVQFARNYGYHEDSCSWFIERSFGNWPEITSFFSKVKPEYRSLALLFLDKHSAKDFRDAKAEILLDHFEQSIPFLKKNNCPNKNFFVEYVMAGRVENEMMVAWRKFLHATLSDGFKGKVIDGEDIKSWILKNISINEIANLHSRAPLTPKGAHMLGVADPKSRDILFVAACRSMGIAARLEPATLLPQYWENKAWKDVYFDPKVVTKKMNAHIQFVNNTENQDPKYETHFTLSRFRNGIFQKLEYGEEIPLSKLSQPIEVDTGNYMLVTGNRQNDGSVLASLTFFRVDAGKTTTVPVKLRKSLLKLKSLGMFKADNLSVREVKKGDNINMKWIVGETGAFIIWMDPDKEPTKHVMVDIPAVRSNLEKWGGNIVFIIPENKSTTYFDTESYIGLPKQKLFVIDPLNKTFISLQSAIDKKLGSNYPYIVFIDKKNQVVYFSEGYKIGIGEQMVKTLQALKY